MILFIIILRWIGHLIYYENPRWTSIFLPCEDTQGAKVLAASSSSSPLSLEEDAMDSKELEAAAIQRVPQYLQIWTGHVIQPVT